MSDEPAASGTTAATARSVPSDGPEETELERHDDLVVTALVPELVDPEPELVELLV